VPDLENAESKTRSENIRTSHYWGYGPALIALFSIFTWAPLAGTMGLPAWAVQGGCWFWAGVLNFLYASWLGADADRFGFGPAFYGKSVFRISVKHWTFVFLALTLVSVIANWNR